MRFSTTHCSFQFIPKKEMYKYNMNKALMMTIVYVPPPRKAFHEPELLFCKGQRQAAPLTLFSLHSNGFSPSALRECGDESGSTAASTQVSHVCFLDYQHTYHFSNLVAYS